MIKDHLSTAEQQQALESAAAIIERYEMGRLSIVPLLHTKELPKVAGVYRPAPRRKVSAHPHGYPDN